MDIDSFIQAVEALDEEELEREVEGLRDQQREITIELNKRLDALAVKQRWEEQKRPEGSVSLPAFGAAQDAQERVRAHSPPEPPSVNGSDAPRGTEAARRVMREGGVWTVKKLHAELVFRGWVNPEAQHPEKATETALSRLHKKYNEVDRVGRGQYRYKTAPHDPNLLDTNGSAES